MEEKEIAKSVIVKEIKITTQTIIINGVEQPSQQNVPVICCPSCGRVLVQFNPGVDVIDVLKYIDENNEQLTEAVRYCTSCGQKLTYPTIIDAEVIK